MVKGNIPLATDGSAVVGPALHRSLARIKESNCLQSENNYSWQSALTLVDFRRQWFTQGAAVFMRPGQMR
jgi:hypothetical protein